MPPCIYDSGVFLTVGALADVWSCDLPIKFICLLPMKSNNLKKHGLL